MTADPAPAIEVVKTATPQTVAAAGDIVIYGFTVTNTGNVTLTNVTLNDNVEGSIALGTTTLAPGESTTGTASHTMTQDEINSGSLTNVATATGTPPTGGDVSDQDTQTVTAPPAPSIVVVKTATPQTVAAAGDIVIYGFTVTNTGNVTLTNVTVSDSIEGAIALGTTTLAPGESTTGTASHTMTQDEIDAGSLTNVAIATGTPPTGGDVTDDDTQTVTAPPAPAILVEKTPDIGDAGQPLNVAAGDIVVFTYDVTNPGNVSLENVVLGDNLEGLLTFVGGDTNNDGELGVDETWTYTANHTVTQDDLDAGVIGTSVEGDLGTATVTGNGVNGGASVSDQDPGGVTLLRSPAIQVVKTPDIGDAGQPLNVAAGDIVVFTYEVSNPGNVSLENVVLGDNLEGMLTFVGGDTNNDGELGVDETWTYTANHTVTQDDLDAGVIGTSVEGDLGTATVTGNGVNGGASVSDQDPGGVTLLQSPAIQVVKTPDIGDAGQPLNVAAGDIVVFTYQVSNPGNVSLDNVALGDNLEGAPAIVIGGDTDLDGELDVDETWIYTADHVVTLADLNAGVIGTDVEGDLGTATVTGNGVNGGASVSGQDPGGVTLLQSPAILVEKSATPNTGIVVGDTVTYDFTVTNTGNVTLTGVTLVDTVEGAIALGTTTLAPGESTTGTVRHLITPSDITNGSLTNVATATGTPPEGPDVTDDDTVTLDFVNLTLTKTVSVNNPVQITITNSATAMAGNGSGAAGDPTASTTVTVTGQTEITYLITVCNVGNAAATDITTTDVIPAGTAYLSHTGSGSLAGGMMTWSIDSLAAGSCADVTVTVTTQL